MVNFVGQTRIRNVRPWGTDHQIGDFRLIGFARIAHFVDARVVRHSVFDAARSNVGQHRHNGHICTRPSRAAVQCQSSNADTGQTRSEVIVGRHRHRVHGERFQVFDHLQCSNFDIPRQISDEQETIINSLLNPSRLAQ